jgi:LysR family transcriptional regulator, nod-box dependent transcriptional activator
MDFHGLDLNLLIALDALIAEKSVTRAGRRVHLSQSAMSGVLARLRQTFNDDLLVPTRGEMMLTPLAQSLAEPVRSVLVDIQKTIATKVRFEPRTSQRTFAVAASDYAIAVLMPQFLRQVKEQAPDVRVAFIPVRERIEAVEDLSLDVLVAPEPYVPQGRPREVLFEDTFTCIVWKGNAHIDDRVTLDQYKALGHVAVSFADHGVKSFDERFAAGSGLDRRVEISVPSYHALPELVVGTDRIATIQTRLAHKLSGSFPLKLVPLPSPLPVLREVMFWPPLFDRDPGHIWFRGLLKDTAASLPALGSDSSLPIPARSRR